MITIETAVATALEALTQAYEAHRHAGVNNFFGHAAGMIQRSLEALEPWTVVRNEELDRWHIQNRATGEFWCRHRTTTPNRYKSPETAQRWVDQLNRARSK